MKRSLIIYILVFFVHHSNAQEKDFFGGIELGLSTTKLNLDSLTTRATVSPVLGVSFQKQFVPKLYGGISLIYTQKNANVISPSVKYQLNFLDWRLSLQYKIQPKLYLETGAVLSQLIEGRAKYSNDSVVAQNDLLLHQINPYVGMRFKVNANTISAKYYIPTILYKNEFISSRNQFSYAEISLNIPFQTKNKEKLKVEEENAKVAKQLIKDLKSGVLLVILSGAESKNVKDRELDQRLVDAFKSYNFSKYFIVDASDIDALRETNKIEVYEDYPFTEKQPINLENFSWFILKSGKNSIKDNLETYKLNAMEILTSDGEKIPNPFPNYVNYSEGSIGEAVQSLNAQLERFYYEASFGL